MEAHHMMNFHHMMELHHVMGFHHCVIRQINFSCALHYAWKVIHLYNFHDELGEMVKPLFVASIASLTLVMTSMASTIQLLHQMGILPTFGTCSNCSSPTGAYKLDGLYNYSGLILQEEAVIVGQYGHHKQQHKVA